MEDLPSTLAHSIAFSAIAAGLWAYHRARLREDRDREETEHREQATEVRVVIMTFADDIITLTCGADNMQKLVDEFAKLIKWIGMLANVKKCVIVCFEDDDNVKFS